MAKVERKGLNIRLQLLKIVLACYVPLVENLRSFMMIGGLFSIIYMIVNFFSGQSLMCANGKFIDNSYCFSNIYIWGLANILCWFVFCVYIRNWLQCVIMKKDKFSIKKILPNKTDLRLFVFVLFIFATITVAFISGFFLFYRNPNPDYRIELLYFSFVSLGFFVPIIGIQFISYIPIIAEGSPLPKPKEIWKKISGQRGFVIMSILSVLLISFLILSSGLNYFRKLPK